MKTGKTAANGRNGGSQWHDYDVWSARYDRYRRPIGIADMIKQTRQIADTAGLSLDRLNFGAFCCGTGANEAQILAQLESGGERFGALRAFDYSPGMLEKARAKLSGHTTPVTLEQIDLVESAYPIPDHSLHVATLIQALQHLDHDNPAFPRVLRALIRIRRKIAADGALIIISSTPDQGYHARWYAHLCLGKFEERKDPAYLHSRSWPDLRLLKDHLTAARFEIVEQRSLDGPYIDREAYLGPPEIVFDADFRSAVSFYGMAEKHGLIPAYDTVARGLIASGEIEKVRAESEEFRAEFGTAFMLVARPIG